MSRVKEARETFERRAHRYDCAESALHGWEACVQELRTFAGRLYADGKDAEARQARDLAKRLEFPGSKSRLRELMQRADELEGRLEEARKALAEAEEAEGTPEDSTAPVGAEGES